MASFYYNCFTDENISSQWIKHLQNNAYIDDIDVIIDENRKSLQSTLRDASDEQKEALRQVCGTLEDGFHEINEHLKSINFNISELKAEINEMASMLDWKLSLLIEEQRITNNLLGRIAELLKVPERQKERVYYIERGLKYLKNAIMEGDESEFFKQAIECFKEAEKRESNDYITLNKIGLIHLYSNFGNHLNFALAEQYFMKSARESLMEANAIPSRDHNVDKKRADVERNKIELDKKLLDMWRNGNMLEVTKILSQEYGLNFAAAHTYINNLNQMKNASADTLHIVKHNNSNPERDKYNEATAESYLYASRACYLQRKFADAAQLARKAYNLVPELLEAGFAQAKYLAANDQETEAAQILGVVLRKGRFFAIKTLEDRDLNNKLSILKLIETLQEETIDQAIFEFEPLKRRVSSRSKATKIISEIKVHISKNCFLSGMKALDLINLEYQLPYWTYSKNGEDIIASAVMEPQKLIHFIAEENYSHKSFIELTSFLRRDRRKGWAWIGGVYGGLIGIVIGFIKGCSFQPLSMNDEILFQITVLFALSGACIGVLRTLNYEPKVIEK